MAEAIVMGEAATVTAEAIVKLILNSISQLEVLAKRWSNASDQWKALPNKLNSLGTLLELFKTAWEEYDIASDESNGYILRALRDAEKSFRTEVEKLQEHNNVVSTMRAMIFPDTLENIIQQLTKTVDFLPELLEHAAKWYKACKDKEDRDALKANLTAELRVKLKGGLQIKPDAESGVEAYQRLEYRTCYVRLEESEEAVQEALENPVKPPIVLLHGRPGTGRSSVARAVRDHYVRKIGQGPFAQVVFLECGKSPVLQIQLELYRTLESGDPLVTTSQASLIKVKSRLTEILKGQLILIILDDVCQSKLINDTIVEICGDIECRCLVTSESPYLCKDLRLSRIPIQAIERRDARRILASHVGLEHNKIPEHLQEIADKMIEAVDSHPMSLACLATGIGTNRVLDLPEWESAYRSLATLLDTADPLPSNGPSPKLKLLDIINLAIARLEDAVVNLFLLAHMCAGPSVPEDVILFFHEYYSKASGQDPGGFTYLRNRLEDHQLIKITKNSLEWGESRDRRMIYIWSLHNLHNRFVSSRRSKDLESLFAVFVGNKSPSTIKFKIVYEPKDVEKRTVACLCSLYFNKNFAKRAAGKLGVELGSFGQWKRTVMEPLISLFVLPTDDQWTEIESGLAMQAFLKYMMEGVLDDRAFSLLLASDLAAPTTIEVLNQIGLTHGKKTPLWNKSTTGILKALIGRLGGETNKDMKIGVLRILRNFSFTSGSVPFLINPKWGCLEGVVRLLLKDLDPGLQVRSTQILINLTVRESAAKKIISNYPGVLEQTIQFLFRDDLPSLQNYSSWLLSHLVSAADGIEICEKLEPVALPRLVKFLQLPPKDGNLMLQEYAAKTIFHLARTGALRATPELMESLSSLLAECLLNPTRDSKEVPVSLRDGNKLQSTQAWAAAGYMLLDVQRDNDDPQILRERTVWESWMDKNSDGLVKGKYKKTEDMYFNVVEILKNDLRLPTDTTERSLIFGGPEEDESDENKISPYVSRNLAWYDRAMRICCCVDFVFIPLVAYFKR